MMTKLEPIAIERVALLRELVSNQTQINDTQQLMEETLKKLADNKVSSEHNSHSTEFASGKENPHLARS